MSSPFDKRYGSQSMRQIFSDQFKYSTWRKLWTVLAESEMELGLNITQEQVDSMKTCINNIDFKLAERIESETNHDVVAHILTFGEQCPSARPIIHLGATSCFVTDNTDVIQQHYALLLLRCRLIDIIQELSKIADLYMDTPTVGYTHYQKAQPTTVGKRVCMWIQDLVMDLDELEHQLLNLRMLGCKGATGTAASFLELFNGDEQKVIELEYKIVHKIECGYAFPISGQTYTRKQDFSVMQVLSGIAQSASKFANDMRLLSNLGEITEPHSKKQVGSSAMPHKVNPIKCERINSLGRFVICNLQNCGMTAATQWMERTLDDSANRRIVIPETFMTVDEILLTYKKVVEGMNVNTSVITEHYTESISTLIAEPLLILLTKKGYDRQEAHQVIREMIGGTKYTGIALNKTFGVSTEEIKSLESRLTGLAEQQTKSYLSWLEHRLGQYDNE